MDDQTLLQPVRLVGCGALDEPYQLVQLRLTIAPECSKQLNLPRSLLMRVFNNAEISTIHADTRAFKRMLRAFLDGLCSVCKDSREPDYLAVCAVCDG